MDAPSGRTTRKPMNRRHFLSHTGGLMLVSTTPILMATENPPASPPPLLIKQSIKTISTGLNRRQWQTISHVQAHLFPAGKNIPSAKDVNAKAFLYAALSDPDRADADRAFIKQGLLDLQALCWKNYQKTFIQLDPLEKEQSLRQLEKTKQGRRWLTHLLGYIFEALLTDPVYGGNPDEIGWKWLEHQAGFPRPTLETRYFLL